MSRVTFTGFPEAALDFYDDLEMDNTKSFWEAHKQTYHDAVRAPMQALVDELAAEFGAAKLFRPHRDVRFAKDKAPYKTHQGAFVKAGTACGWYVELSARGVFVAGGFYEANSANLARIRAAIADDKTGQVLTGLIETGVRNGFELSGDTLKTAPRGFDVTHPRIELLRHRTLSLGRHYGFGVEIRRADLVDAVRADWQRLRPVVEWVAGRIE